MPETESNPARKVTSPHVRGLLKRLLRFAWPYRFQMGIGLVILVGLSLSYGFIPRLIRIAIDDYIDPSRTGHLDTQTRIDGLARTCLWIAGFTALMFVTRSAHAYLMSWIGQHTINDLRQAVFAKIMGMHLQFFDVNPVGRLMTRITSDLDALQRFVTDGLIGLVANLFLLTGIVIFMFLESGQLALLLLITVPLLVGSLTFINLQVRRAHRLIRERQSNLNALLQENISGMSTVQIFAQEERSRTRFVEKNERLFSAREQGIFWFSFYFPSLEVINGVAMFLILALGGWMVLDSSSEVGVGMLVAFLLYIRDFFRPLEELSDKSHLYQTAMASAERIFGLMDEVEALDDPTDPVPLAKFRGEIEFRNVWFAYQEEDWVLRNVSFRVAPGQSLAIVGATGAGKTSIISLVSRFYDVQRGEVRVDGYPVQAYAQSELRRHIGIVLQDPFVFSGTVAANISMNNPALTHQQLIEAAQFVNAHAFIEKLPQGYDTELGERGATLSTGQKQLLALARAIVQDPDILLVLDEATANVDTETEALIQVALKKVMQGRTSIIIAHRLSTIKDVNRILVMRQGQLVESGNHSELIAKDGYYRALYELLAHGEGV